MTRQSINWYNDALTKARIRDLSGAMTSLERALQYDRTNLPARNLLGLIQYGRGEVTEALSTWMVTRMMHPRNQLANYFINSVQEQADELQAIGMAIHKYNQGLRYCRDGNVDMAILQLAEAVDIFPGLMRAWQLLALIYLTRRQYAKARKALARARAIDEGDELTLTYWHDLKKVRPRRIARQEETDGSKHSVRYKRGNETIIRPLEEVVDAGTGKIWTNIVIGLIMGAALVFLLIGPFIRSRANKEASQLIAAYTDKIAAQQAQIDALKTELEEYRRNPDLQTTDDTKTSVKDSYENLVKSVEEYANHTNADETILNQMLKINKDQLGEIGKEKYEKVANDLFPKYVEYYFNRAKAEYGEKNYKDAAEYLKSVLKMEDDYSDGEAMLMLANTYMHLEDKKNAKIYYKLVIKNHKDNAIAKAAKSGLEGKIVELSEVGKEESSDAQTQNSQSGTTQQQSGTTQQQSGQTQTQTTSQQ